MIGSKTDAPTVRRVDYLGEVHFDPERKDGALAQFTAEGFLRVDARLTRTGVFTYGDADGNAQEVTPSRSAAWPKP